MTFKDAKQQLAAIAAGRYHALFYSETIDHRGKVRPECRVYIDPGLSSNIFPTWEMAFQALDTMMHGTSAEVIAGQEPTETAEVAL